ncbi:hypothetical protein DPQ25_09705 [Hydrogeniiclostridium mannosilyticum]|uniref:histidine kinase n=1 Tax=Hydrogeniiclostridium mannosilyticum TaxID=2764322 RepID=A0A328UGU2_9FIRM|nr:hypothetical protein DPQ25_09705 [Hydrogeniiclostridium mannosilyticum]
MYFEGQDATILAKERWIYQAVGNLIDNAVKYGSEQPIAVFVQTRHGSVIITVQDHGIGIPLERQEQIFQNRYRVHQLKRDGYGIGLSLVAPAAAPAYSGGDFCPARPLPWAAASRRRNLRR